MSLRYSRIDYLREFFGSTAFSDFHTCSWALTDTILGPYAAALDQDSYMANPMTQSSRGQTNRAKFKHVSVARQQTLTSC